MTLIKSISGIRGTIGGKPGDTLSPLDIVKYAAAFGYLVKRQAGPNCKMVIGRDARMSGEMVNHLVIGTLMGIGIDVLDLGLSTTPTVEMAVVMENAQGGIILTASHNPKQWNALKLLNAKGEFISEELGKEVLQIADSGNIEFADVEKLGSVVSDSSYIQKHIDAILKLELVDVEAIQAANFKVVVDAVNSTGGIAVPLLLKALGVNEIIPMFCEPDGKFPHNPEPLPENLTEFDTIIKQNTVYVVIKKNT